MWVSMYECMCVCVYIFSKYLFVIRLVPQISQSTKTQQKFFSTVTSLVYIPGEPFL